MMRLAEAPFSGKGLAPFLDAANPERGEACARLANLFFEMRNSKLEWNAAVHVLEPLLRLLPDEPRAAEPLATMAHLLADGHAYPEALRCIDAVVDLASEVPLGHTLRGLGPWNRESAERMTWPREQALLRLMRGVCHLAAGDEARGEASLAEGIASADAARMPPYFQLTRSMYEYGTTADFRLFGLALAARALRRRFEGGDASAYRKIKKRKAGESGDRALLETARRYVDKALATVAPRAATQYAELVPDDRVRHPALTQTQRDYAWQASVYLESALVTEHLGDGARARLHLGRARWIAALIDPSGRSEPEIYKAADRLSVENTPLDDPPSQPPPPR